MEGRWTWERGRPAADMELNAKLRQARPPSLTECETASKDLFGAGGSQSAAKAAKRDVWMPQTIACVAVSRVVEQAQPPGPQILIECLNK